MKQPTIIDAINSIVPDAQWMLRGDKVYENIEWHTTDVPTKQQVEDELSRLIAEYETNEYQRQRAAQYPQLGDQLDMLWHAIDTNNLNKTSDFYTAIKAVKDANPKSGE